MQVALAGRKGFLFFPIGLAREASRSSRRKLTEERLITQSSVVVEVHAFAPGTKYGEPSWLLLDEVDALSAQYRSTMERVLREGMVKPRG